MLRLPSFAPALLALCAGLAGSFAACAQDTSVAPSRDHARWYVGAGLGTSYHRLNKDDFSVPVPGHGRDHEQKMACTKLFAGYELLPQLSVEVQYHCLGESKLKYTRLGTGQRASVTYSVSALSLAAVGRLPLGDTFSLIGKAGPAWTEAESRSKGNVVAEDKRTERRLGYMAGIGMEWRIGAHYGVRTELESYHRVGNADGPGRASVQAGSASFFYRF
jgi:opacity protein-like surface antigen